MTKFTAITVKRSTGKSVSGKGVWLTAQPDFVYLAYSSGRAYWHLTKIPVAQRPKISFSDSTMTMRINTYRITFKKRSDYTKVKGFLARSGRRVPTKTTRKGVRKGVRKGSRKTVRKGSKKTKTTRKGSRKTVRKGSKKTKTTRKGSRKTVRKGVRKGSRKSSRQRSRK